MATSSDEIKGEVSSKSLKSVNAWLRLQNAKRISKRKTFNYLANLNFDDHHNHLDPTNNLSTWSHYSHRRRMRCIPRRLPVDDYFHRLSVTNSINKDIPGTTLCSKCGAVFCPKNGNLCNNCLTCLNIQEDNVDGIPSSLAVKYCQGCQSYSFTGRANFVPASTLSTALLSFLLRRIDIHLYRLHLSLLGASFLPTDPNPSIIKIALLLQEDAVDGLNLMKRHIINYIVAHQTCYRCSSQKPASQITNVVQFRQCDSDKRTIGRFILKIGSYRREVALKKMKLVKKGLDFYFDTIDDAITYFSFMCTRLPIKPDKLQISPSNKDYIIPALVCPIGHEDLVYIRSNKVLVDLGFSGPLVICTSVTNCISLMDPLKLIERTITADEYWNEPNAFDLYKNARDLVEYVVLDVQIISKEDEYSLADLLVVQSGDFGRSDIAFTTRTHLGHVLKIGDYAFGYDLYSGNNNNTGNMISDEQRESLPDVILVKKRGERMRPPVRKKNTSPEYEEFLRELDNNPEAMFSLSLNGDNKDKNKQPVKDGEGSDFDLGGLLADLALGDKQDTDTPGRSDEQHR